MALHTAEAGAAQIAIELLDGLEQHLADPVFVKLREPLRPAKNPVAHCQDDGLPICLDLRRKRAATGQDGADTLNALLTLDDDIMPLTLVLHRLASFAHRSRHGACHPNSTFETARYRIHWPAPQELLRRFPQLDVVRLPASRRLPQDTVNLVQPAFYRQLPFSSAAAPAERRLRLDAATQGDTIDRALDMLADGATLVGVLLPPAEFGLEQVDNELAATMAEIAARLLARQPRWEGVRQLTAADIGAIDAHVASGAAVRRSLRAYNMPTDACVVETPELWQGQERPLMVVKHTLSGQRQIGEFGLEPGRWCVMLLRHQIGCVIVGRDGVGDVLAEHRHDCGARPIGSVDAAWEGWRAHQAIWGQLEVQGRLLRIG